MGRVVDLNNGKKYEVIYADPPWRYEFPPMGMTKKSIEYHYPTMTIEEIKDLDIPSADDAVLFLWATAPKLTEIFEVIKEWGFTYRTCIVWDKTTIGMGYWCRNQHELLLISTKGHISPPAPKLRISSVYREKKTKHSAKPNFFRCYIDKCFPSSKKLELFARQQYEGWDAFGDELDGTIQKNILKKMYNEDPQGIYKINCVVCNKEFYCKRPEGKYCSYRCRNDAYIQNRRLRKQIEKQKSCVVCGVSFLAKRKDSLYCSAKCKQQIYRERVTDNGCGKSSTTRNSNNVTNISCTKLSTTQNSNIKVLEISE